MDNIYGQTEIERNSIVEIPEGYAKNAGIVLYSWLGSLWRGLHKGDGLVRGLQAARGIRLAQLYINILEAAKLKDRYGAPVFHRELWHPIVIRMSERNTAQENMLKIGMDGVVGPQDEGSVYGAGTIFEMGRMANFKEYVTYPCPADISGGAMSIVDSIIAPSVSMENGKDFIIRNKSIIFPKDNDPLNAGSPFEKYDVPGFMPDDPSKSDAEAVLWASDVLIDRNYISEHISYVLGADAPSADTVKRILNAAWSSVASGLTPELIRTLMAAMMNVPVIQQDREVVADIETEMDDDGNPISTIVHTDKGSYRVSIKARLRDDVYPGSVLRRGDLLDESLRVYPFLNGVRYESGSSDSESYDSYGHISHVDTGFSVPLELDIPSVVLPKDIIRAKTEYGVYAMWGRSMVRRSESSPLDANGNPHLYFEVGGTDDDVKSFWQNIWDEAESRNVSMASIIGEEGSIISPAAFLMQNVVGANTLFVVVDKSQSDDTSMMHDPMFFDMLSSVVPSSVRLFLVEHESVDEDMMDMGLAGEGEFLAAALPDAVDRVSESDLPGLSGRGSAFGERVSMRLIRPAPAKKRGKKEEEK